MCGISGGIGTQAPDKLTLENQLMTMEHRGPDDSGIYIAPGISLGMCRLAIVEISNGKQPASDNTNSIHLVWNGEIYNYREIRNKLVKFGVEFKLSSESEVIIQAYKHWGINFVNELNGMFAIAIFDSINKQLVLIRDRMGKKPLWISEFTDGSLIFASEVKAIMKARRNLTFRSDSISEVMQYGYINSPNSSFNEIKQLPPGSYLISRNGVSNIKTYWEPNFTPKISGNYDEVLKKTESILEDSVKRRLISERPIGSFLSGGFDSTVVTALMVRLSETKVKTFSIGFDNLEFDESSHAKKVADYLGTEHHEEIIKPDANLVIEKISKLLDQPFADSSIIPTYLLSKFAKQDITVALSGDGGDEIFGGYDRYLVTPILQKLNPFLPLVKAGLSVTGNLHLGQNRKIKKASSQIRYMNSFAYRYLSIQSLTQIDELTQILHPDFFTDINSNKFIETIERKSSLSKLDQLVHSDLKYYLPGDILPKIDLASMANSLELRSPMLDKEVVEWGLSLPDNYRIKGLETKHILKDLARKLVPKELIDRPKMGFGIPRADWLRFELHDMLFDVLTDNSCLQRGWFNKKEVEQILKLHMSGIDKDNILWPILMIELWAQNWLDTI